MPSDWFAPPWKSASHFTNDVPSGANAMSEMPSFMKTVLYGCAFRFRAPAAQRASDQKASGRFVGIVQSCASVWAGSHWRTV